VDSDKGRADLFPKREVVKSLIVFRYADGSYVMVLAASSAVWFENPSIEFLGEVRSESFEHKASFEIEDEIEQWSLR
jgi:hypothetical protein